MSRLARADKNKDAVWRWCASTHGKSAGSISLGIARLCCHLGALPLCDQNSVTGERGTLFGTAGKCAGLSGGCHPGPAAIGIDGQTWRELAGPALAHPVGGRPAFVHVLRQSRGLSGPPKRVLLLYRQKADLPVTNRSSGTDPYAVNLSGDILNSVHDRPGDSDGATNSVAEEGTDAAEAHDKDFDWALSVQTYSLNVLDRESDRGFTR